MHAAAARVHPKQVLETEIVAQAGVHDGDGDLRGRATSETLLVIQEPRAVMNGQHLAQMAPPEQQARMSS